MVCPTTGGNAMSQPTPAPPAPSPSPVPSPSPSPFPPPSPSPIAAAAAAAGHRSVQGAFALGWHMAELFVLPARTVRAPVGSTHSLPLLRNLAPPQRLEILL